MTKYERLRKAATKATCGSWSLDYGDDFFYDGDALICREIVGYLPICRVEGAHPKSGFEEGFIKEQQHNAEFIAAANPITVLELLDELEAAEKRIAELESRKVGLPVASCTVEDGEMCIDGFSEYVGHSLPDGVHDLYTALQRQQYQLFLNVCEPLWRTHAHYLAEKNGLVGSSTVTYFSKT